MNPSTTNSLGLATGRTANFTTSSLGCEVSSLSLPLMGGDSDDAQRTELSTVLNMSG